MLPPLLALVWAYRRFRVRVLPFVHAHYNYPKWQWFHSNVQGVRFKRSKRTFTFVVDYEVCPILAVDAHDLLNRLHAPLTHITDVGLWVGAVGLHRALGVLNLLGKVDEVLPALNQLEEWLRTDEPVECTEIPDALSGTLVNPGARRNRNLEL